MLNLNQVIKKYGKNIILDKISISFDEAGLYILKGINGSGKSTLLKILSNVIYKSSGELEISEVISFLPDKYSMPKLIRVDKYLKLIFKLNNSFYNVKETIKEWKIMKKNISNLSKGNIQKVGIIQILSLNADCYIFDEPLDGLDDFAQELFKNKIINLIESNKKVIISLHDDTLFSDIKYKIFCFKDGTINEEN